MDTYPSSYASQQHGPEAQALKRLADESGHPTPTHGGMVTGMEYDMVIDTRSPNRDPSPLRPTETAATTSSKARAPLKPLAAPASVAASASTETNTQTSTSTPPSEEPEPPAALVPRPQSTANGTRQRPASMPPQAHASAPATTEPRSSRNHDSQHRSKQGGRVLGSYTMTKTLGAGSMGKVKLSTHNQTGEKVRCDCLCTSHVGPLLISGTWTNFPACNQNRASNTSSFC